MRCRMGVCRSARDNLVLLCCGLVYMNGGLLCINGLLIIDLLDVFEAGKTITTWVATVQVAMCLFGGFFAGSLVELYGCRVVAVAGSLIAALGYVISAFVNGIPALFFVYSFLTGLGLGLAYVPCLAVPQQVFTEWRVIATALVVCGASSGSFIYPIMYHYLREMYGYRGALLISGGICFHSVPLSIVMTSHPDQPRPPPTNIKVKDAQGETKAGLVTENAIPDGSIEVNSQPAHLYPQAKLISQSNPNIGVTCDIPSSHDKGRLRSDLERYDVLVSNPKVAALKVAVQSECSSVPNVHRSVDAGLHHLKNGRLESSPIRRGGRTVSGVECDKAYTQFPHVSDSGIGIEDTAIEDSSPGALSELRRAAEEMKQGLMELKHGPCLVVFMGVFFIAGGYQIPYIFIPTKAEQLGFTKQQAAWLLFVMGVADTLSRLFCGGVANIFKPMVPVIWGLGMLSCAIGTLGCVFWTSYIGLEICCIVFGWGIGCYVCLYTQSAIEIVGLSKIVRMIGLVSFSWGVAYLTIPSLCAFLFETTGNLDVPFYIGSSLIFLAALTVFTYRISPAYKNRPGAIEAANEIVTEDLSRHDMSSVALSRTTLKSASIYHMGSRDVSWFGSTPSRIYHVGLTPVYTSALSVNASRPTDMH